MTHIGRTSLGWLVASYPEILNYFVPLSRKIIYLLSINAPYPSVFELQEVLLGISLNAKRLGQLKLELVFFKFQI